MSDPTAQEPTMEEILASIRRIISEDDAPAAAPEPAAPAKLEEPPRPEPAAVQPAAPPAPPPPPEPVHVAEPEEDILELTEPAPPTETHGDLDVFTPEPPPVRPPPSRPAPAAKSYDDEALISGGSEDKVASHFGLLSQSILMPPAGRTLEDVVRELLKPLLKEWLDEHLPLIVEEKVQAEVERIARRRV
jgi:cell pole-organizing protein PopZ